jgi:hypothetical protein
MIMLADVTEKINVITTTHPNNILKQTTFNLQNQIPKPQTPTLFIPQEKLTQTPFKLSLK